MNETASALARAQTAWAHAFMSALHDAGVSDVVISPGSRSTPFVAAAARSGFRCFTIIDERAAGFFALGRAKLTQLPVALLCTSGSAGCHYYPAIAEASYSCTPLIAITADRPAELHGCGAAQAMDQTRLFGGHVRAAIELGSPQAGEHPLRAVQRKATQAVAAALTPTPGPVHINAPARKPLEPTDDVQLPVRRRARVHTGVAKVSARGIESLVSACKRSRRGVIVAGPARVKQRELRPLVAELSARTGYPVLAEATSQLRLSGGHATCDGFAALLSSPAFVAAHRPELIIQLGAPPAGWELNRYLDGSETADRFVIAEHGWVDPASNATALLVGAPADALARVTAELRDAARPSQGQNDWLDAFRRGSEVAWRCVETALGEPRAQPGEDQIMRALVSGLPDGCLLGLGNSLPVRTIDWFCPARRDLDIWHQRGLNGIDGLIAGVAGAASARGGPTVLVLGDISFAHDVGGLAAAHNVDSPLAIVVIDNQGGRIFDYLPIAGQTNLAPEYRRHWLAAQQLDICAAATSYGHTAVRVAAATELSTELRAAVQRNECTVIHAPVEPTSAKQSKHRIAAAVEREYRSAG